MEIPEELHAFPITLHIFQEEGTLEEALGRYAATTGAERDRWLSSLQKCEEDISKGGDPLVQQVKGLMSFLDLLN